MPHGEWIVLYNPWGMGNGYYSITHGSWVVQWYLFSMGHGLYNALYNVAWPMTHGELSRSRPANGENPVAPDATRLTNREPPVAPDTVRPTNRSTPVATGPTIRDTAPPSYTEQVGQDPRATGNPRIEREPMRDTLVSGQNPAYNREESLSEPGTVMQSDRGLGGSVSSEDSVIAETDVTEQHTTRSQNARTALDREIVETIRGIAREQKNLRTELVQEQRNLRSEIQSARQEQRDTRIEIHGVRRDAAELQSTAKTHESRLGLLFKRIGDVIDDQWIVREGMDELKRTYEARVPARSPIKAEPKSTNGGNRDSNSAPIVRPRSDIESLYASEEDNQEVVPEDAIRQPQAGNTRGGLGSDSEPATTVWTGNRGGAGTMESGIRSKP
ncbi:hypothetical protein BJ322DRAFT_1023539 [Thelephora terrestris]|uniref:Uncharacterized protein n=1 Tax=Thelephora terrestris TaxID=56493 RepID=A0A9P6H7J9_9AGAM|nr:hypothetical protein BJ322DRAFT_1023539 [Thelephora terrestris]